MEFLEVYQKGKRDRSENFSKDECSLLLKLVLKRKAIIENRKTDNATNAAKNHAWNDLATEYNAYNEGPTREAKTLKTKYEAIKKYTKKRVLNEGSDKRKEKEKPSWEEMELREMIMENLQQYPQQQQENSNGSSGTHAEEQDEWGQLQKSIHEGQVEVMMDDNSPAKDDESTRSKYVLQRIGNNTEEDGTLFEPGGDPLSGEQQKTETTQENNKTSTDEAPRRRYKKRFRPILPAPSTKYDDEKTAKIATLKLETAIIEREIAKTNLAAAKARLRTAEIEEETAMLTKRSKLLSNCRPSVNSTNTKPSTSVHQNEFGEVFTNL